jgi:hypothetical protein
MDEDTTVREDLGYQKNTPESSQNYRILKDKRIYGEQGNSPEKSRVCRVRFKSGEYEGDIKRLAWQFAEPLLKTGRVEFIEWVRTNG